ncbi:hypothetical protein [uncultured Fusobacterium sp.]|uniref:hypothetical protein n=1 Tax=uncultured Fusobacterium sp. TaxID=159267 RepID=UPI000BBA4DB8|nr:hypothetical protein [uncultured Fusobacterium sp.]BBA51009.1 hypothetical protein FV113G1_13580 [Fusobacterium varium]
MFLSPEEKLLAFRKKHKITQGELVGDDITRVFLGMIEIGKRSLTEKTAKLLCKNFTKILGERGIKDSIKLSDLMKTKEEQALEYLENVTKDVNSDLKENIWEIEEALFELNDNDRSEYCMKLFVRFANEKNYLNARDYILKSLHGIRKIVDLKEKLLEIMKLNKILGDYKNSVFTYRKFEDRLLKEKWSREYEMLQYKYAEALVETEGYTEALNILKLLFKKSKNEDFLFEVRKMIAKTYKNMSDYEEASKEYVSLAKGRSSEEKAEAYSKLIEIGIITGDKVFLKKFYEKCKDNYEINGIKEECDNFDVLVLLAKGAKELGKTKDSRSFYMEALMVGKNSGCEVEERMEIITELFQMFEKSDFYSVQSIENEYISLLELKKDYKPAIKILEYYQKNMPSEVLKKFEIF